MIKEMELEAEQDIEEYPTVICKFCNSEILTKTAHLHQGQYIGDCCWDERLKITE